MESFFSYAGQVSIGDEVLVERNHKLVPKHVVTIQDINTGG